MINIRKNVFETNSSSMHNYTFKKRNVRDKKTLKMCLESANEEEYELVEFKGAGAKYAAIEWLLNIMDLSVDFISFFEGYNVIYVGKYNKHLIIDNIGENILRKIKLLLNKSFNYPNSDLIDDMKNIILNYEYEAFKDLDYKYDIKNLSDNESIVLAIKFIYLIKSIIPYIEKIENEKIWIEETFNQILDKNIDDSFIIVKDLLDNQLMTETEFNKMFEDIKNYLDRKSFDTQYEKAHKILSEIEELDYYDFYDLISNFELNYHSYEQIKKSIIEILNNNNIVIDMF